LEKNRKLKRRIIFAVMIIAVFVLTVADASQNRGAKEMNLEAGSKGKVFFPHYNHQEAIGDCQVCHSLFPQNSGAVVKLKTEGSLKKST
jgi:hypothetical protein